MLEEVVMCLHQFSRPEQQVKIHIESVGDCYSCQQDEYNKHCGRYFPITVQLMEVYKNGKGQDK